MAARHIETGKKGELMAAEYLQQQGFMVLHRNWCYYHYEIDIIASKNNVLHFIEVKTRSSHHFGFPEESVSKKKLSNIMKCATQYQYLHPQWKRIQYDILSVNLHVDKAAEFMLIEDVYL